MGSSPKSTSKMAQLDQHFDDYRKQSPIDDMVRAYTFQTFEPFMSRPESQVLEIGCSNGLMTELIANKAGHLDVVEGSVRFLEEAKARALPNVAFHHRLLEDFESAKKYDYIFATFLLTHIENLGAFLQKTKELMAPDARLFVAVPNARVMSRQLACHMGLVEDLYQLTENDRNHGHCRVFDRLRLSRELESHGLRHVAQGGILVKPLADFQMDELIRTSVLADEHIQGLYALGAEYPELCGTIYSVCEINHDA